ncbi:terminase small subunit [Bacillus sp. WLY-B-L8]|uniref:terminase small subunit n=1 Tax=Bacillus multifaciens TaxID=3068506 RepID=UPI002742732D|nr:terminase small subunit [Bacillus sp. WLY-B-L8]MDP7981025.1 terminase small subunit [Bacillus sp. WLY-B-L8]
MKLTLKQQAFCDYYIETGNATEAARKAGYSQKTAKEMGNENLSKPHLKAYIEERMSQKEEERVASQDEILEFLTKVMRGETTEQVPVGQGEGYFELQDKDTYVKDRVKAAELLGKRHMMWTEKKEVEITVPTFVDDVPIDADE